jgi:hypothetical protein
LGKGRKLFTKCMKNIDKKTLPSKREWHDRTSCIYNGYPLNLTALGVLFIKIDGTNCISPTTLYMVFSPCPIFLGKGVGG